MGLRISLYIILVLDVMGTLTRNSAAKSCGLQGQEAGCPGRFNISNTVLSLKEVTLHGEIGGYLGRQPDAALRTISPRG